MSAGIEAWVSGALDGAAEAEFEARLFAEPALAAEAARLLALRDALIELDRQGPMVPVMLRADAAALARAHRALEATAVAGRIDSALTDEEFVVAHIPAPLGDARSVDVWICTPEGVPYFIAREVPFSPEGVSLVCRSHVARAAGKLRVQVRDQDARVRAEIEIENHPPR